MTDITYEKKEFKEQIITDFNDISSIIDHINNGDVVLVRNNESYNQIYHLCKDKLFSSPRIIYLDYILNPNLIKDFSSIESNKCMCDFHKLFKDKDNVRKQFGGEIYYHKSTCDAVKVAVYR